MGFNTFDKDIKMGLKKVYLLHGHEKYLIEQYIEKLIGKYVPETYRDFNLTIFDGEKVALDELIDTCETVPFFSENKIVIVKNVQYFRSKKTVVSDSEEKRLIEYFNNPSETTNLIMISNVSVDSRKKTTKAVKVKGSVIEFEKLSEQIFYKWVHKKIIQQGKNIEGSESRYLVDRLGYLDKNSTKNLLDIDNELKMICSSLIDGESIKREDIDKFIKKPLDSDIFMMVDALGQRKVDRALSIMNQLLLGGEVIQVIFSMICRQFRLIKKIKMLIKDGYGQSDIPKIINVHPYVVKTVMRQINVFDDRILTSILEKCSELDYKMKSSGIDSRLGVETLIVECSLMMK